MSLNLSVVKKEWNVNGNMQIFVYLAVVVTAVQGLNDAIRLGGLFHVRDNLQELAFLNAVEYTSRVLSKRLVAQARRVPEHNSFQVSRTVCEMISTGVAAIFGPESPETATHVQSICDAKEIPHIETRWDPNQRSKLCSLNVYPHPASLSQALVDVVKAWRWKTFTVIYQTEYELVKFSEVLKLSDSKEYVIIVRQLDEGDNYRETLRTVKNSGSTNIILDCSIEILPEVLKQAQQVGLMVAEYSFIIANLDLHTIDLEFLQYGGTNITGFSLVNPEDKVVIDTVRMWSERESKNQRVLGVTPSNVRLDAALMNDAVWLFSKAARELHYAKNVSVMPLDCSSKDAWSLGTSLANYMKHTEVKGMTGLVKIHKEEGFRIEFTLHLNELTGEGLKSIGTWNTTQGLNLTRPFADLNGVGDDENLVNKTFIVLIAMSPPYGMLKEDSRQLSGNDRFEGFGIDLIHELSLMLGFNYTYVVQHDGNFRVPEQGDEAVERDDEGDHGREGRSGNHGFDNHARPGERCRLHDAIHDAGHQHLIQTADATAAESLLLPVALLERSLDVHAGSLLRRLVAAVLHGENQPV
ncbi:UNVERIFIED_CONTAM: hypothetical protein PYX00_003377 [Menopon gallinae]|uniref:Ionotropic glutamate receptor L-glutamate and glycine-binding domain-containing protein n=1 Tax=Menopon gallinae TaxID=328185 RepID=A0AAW2HZT6_9NEOP